MPFGDGMKMGEGLAVNLSCGHPHVDTSDSGNLVMCPLCSQVVEGSLRELPNEEKPHEQ